MASIPCAADQAGHIHDHMRKQRRFEVRMRAASVDGYPPQPLNAPPATITTLGQKPVGTVSVSTEEIGG